MITKAVGVILTPVYTAYLTRADYGIMSFVLMLSSMAGTLMFLGQTGSLILFYRSTSEEAEHRRELLFNVFWFTMLFAGVLMLVAYALGPRYSYLITGSKGIPFYPYLSIGLLIAFLGLPQAMQQAINRAQGQATLYTSLALHGLRHQHGGDHLLRRGPAPGRLRLAQGHPGGGHRHAADRPRHHRAALEAALLVAPPVRARCATACRSCRTTSPPGCSPTSTASCCCS